MWREIQRIRESKEGTHFQIGTIVKWKPDHATQQLLQDDFDEWVMQAEEGAVDPYMDAIMQGLYWRGVVVEPPPDANSRFALRDLVDVRSLRIALRHRVPARRNWIVLKEYLVPVRRPTGHIGDQAAHAAQLRFADNPNLAPPSVLMPEGHRDQNVWTARLIADKKFPRGEGADLWPAVAGLLGDVPPEYIEPSHRQPARGTQRLRRDDARDARDGRFRGARRLALRARRRRRRRLGLPPLPPRLPARTIYTNNPVVTAGEAARRASTLAARGRLTVGGNSDAAADAVLEDEHNAMDARDQEMDENAAFWAEELPGPNAGGRRRQCKSRRRRRRRRKSRRTRRKC